MARSKKNQSKKTTQKPKHKEVGRKNPSPKQDGAKLAKSNLQPARVIKKPEPSVATLNDEPKAAPLEISTPKTVVAPPVTSEKPKTSEASPLSSTKKPPKIDKKKAKSVIKPESELTKAPKEPHGVPEVASITSSPDAVSSTSVATVSDKKTRWNVKRVLAVLAVALLLGAVGLFVHVRSASGISKENKKTIAEVSKLAVLPTNETPAITTVVDEARVNQPFLYGTKKGDKVLLYFQAGRAIVYRPSSHQIVNMGPLETPKARVFIRNGSTNEQAPDAIANKISASTDYLVASRDDSQKKSYTKTVVIDVSGVRPDVAKRLAEYLDANVGNLPDGESQPDSDMLVIVGNDQTTP